MDSTGAVSALAFASLNNINSPPGQSGRYPATTALSATINTMKHAYWIAIAVVLVFVVASFATGIYLMSTYRPTLEHANNDILALTDADAIDIYVTLHRWLSAFLPLTVIAYLVVSVVASVGRNQIMTKRRIAGIVSVVAALTVIGGGWFTGRLLPWYHLASWAEADGMYSTRATPLHDEDLTPHESEDSSARFGMLGNQPTDNESTLNRTYVVHCLILPITLLALLVLSTYLLRPSSIHSQSPSANAG